MAPRISETLKVMIGSYGLREPAKVGNDCLRAADTRFRQGVIG